MIDGKNIFVDPVKKYILPYESIRKTDISQGDDYITDGLQDYLYFK